MLSNKAAGLWETALFHEQSGEFAEALRLLEKCARTDPKAPIIQYRIGMVQHSLGRFRKAVNAFDKAIALDPTFADAYGDKGVALAALREFEPAVAAYDQALKLDANYMEAWYNQGIALMALGRQDEAIAAYRRAIDLNPRFVLARLNLGVAMKEKGDFKDARSLLDTLLLENPRFAEAYANRAIVRMELLDREGALADCVRAVELRPDFAIAHANRGLVLTCLERQEEALESLNHALSLDPLLPEAHAFKGALLHERKEFDAALKSLDRALSLNTRHGDATLQKGMTLLLSGRLREAWPYYQTRVKGIIQRNFKQPAWTGHEDIAGKKVLIHWEQGLGDTIQFCRYTHLLAERGAQILFAPQKPLRGLMRSLGETIQIVDETDEALQFDYHVRLLDLPQILGTDLASIPAQVPYLKADPARVAHWRARIGTEGFKIGICWQGSKALIDAGRSFPLAKFAPLSALPGVRLISLHKGEGEDQLQDMPAGMKVETLGADFDSGPDAFADTAAAMQSMDLIISSDTAVAHVAGALACKTWVALKYVPDWRWLVDRDDSPWYPTTRLFRQNSLGDWDDVFARISAAVQSEIDTRTAI